MSSGKILIFVGEQKYGLSITEEEKFPNSKKNLQKM